MKHLLKLVFVNFLTLLFISKICSSIYFFDNFLVLFWAAVTLTLLNLLVKPVLNILLMPINFLTLGGFRWIINFIVLFLVTLIVPEFKISAFVINGFSFAGFSVPTINLSFLLALFLVSFLIEMFSGIIFWLFK